MKRAKPTEPLAGMEVAEYSSSLEEATTSEVSRVGREKRKRVDSRGRNDTGSDSDLLFVEGNPVVIGTPPGGDPNAGMARLIESVLFMLGKCTQIQGKLKGRMKRNLLQMREMNLASRSRVSPPRVEEGLRERVKELEDELGALRGELETREMRIMELHAAAVPKSPVGGEGGRRDVLRGDTSGGEFPRGGRGPLLSSGATRIEARVALRRILVRGGGNSGMILNSRIGSSGE